MRYIVGMDVGGTKCAVTLAKEHAEGRPEILSKRRFETAALPSPDAVMARFAEELSALLAAAELAYTDISAIGISCGGPLDARRGVVLSPPNLPGWDEVYITDYFQEKTGIPTYLQNDANASAVAEWLWGAGRGTRSMVFLTFGTGLGAGLILDGRLYSGAHDMAGEIGHVRLEPDGPIGYGKHGSAEGFCSGGGLRQLGVAALQHAEPTSPLYLATEGDPARVNAKLLAELADAGDPLSTSVYRLCAEHLGMTLAILCDVVDPERIVLGGIYMRSAHLLSEQMQRVLREEALTPCEVCAAGLGEQVGDYAACAVASYMAKADQ